MPDETKTGQDTKGSSEGGKGTSDNKEPKTFTEEEHQKGISDALSKAGRTAKALEARENAVKAAEDKQAQWRKEQEEEQARRDAEELQRYQDDPDKMDVVKGRQANRGRAAELDKREADIVKREAENQSRIEAADKSEREKVIISIASEHGIDYEDLNEAMAELGLENPTKEQIGSIAKRMAKSGETTTTPLKPDSSRTKGGGEDLDGLSPRAKLSKGLNK